MTAAEVKDDDARGEATSDGPRAEASGGSTVAGGLHPALAAGLDWIAQHETVQRLHTYALSAVQLGPGMTVLDVGCGTGAYLRTLVDAVHPHGRAVGLDTSHPMTIKARQRDLPFTAVLTADARRLPFPDSSVDAAWCERVLQHLPEPRQAVAEIVRVLRPGGRIVAIDTDWTTMTIFPGDPAVTQRVVDAWGDRTPGGRARRHLPGLLIDAGLGEFNVTREIFTSRDAAAPVIPPFPIFVRIAISSGSIDEEQARSWLQELLEAGRRGTFFWSVTMCAAVGSKLAH